MKPTLLAICLITVLFPQFLTAQKNAETYIKANYCSLFNSSKNLEGKLVRTRAFMTYSTVSRVDGGDSFFYLPECNGGDYFSTIGDSPEIKNIQKLNKVIENSEDEKHHILEIEFIGKIETSIIPSFGHLAWSLSEIQLAEIIFVKNVSNKIKVSKKPKYEAETSLLNRGKGLKDMNSYILFSLLKRSSTENDLYLSDNFVLIDKNGKDFKKVNITDFSVKNLFNLNEDYESMFIKGPGVETKNGLYIASGICGVKYKNGKEKMVKYVNTFKHVEDSWRLIKTEFLEK